MSELEPNGFDLDKTRSTPDEDRRRFLELAKGAAFTAPAVALLLAASTEMALPYGGGGGGGGRGGGPQGNNGKGNGGGDGVPGHSGFTDVGR